MDKASLLFKASFDKASLLIKQEMMDIELDGISDGSHMGSPLVHPQMDIDGFEFTGGFSTDDQIASMSEEMLHNLGK